MVMVRVMGMAMVTMMIVTVMMAMLLPQGPGTYWVEADEQTMGDSEAERGVAPSRGGGVASNSKV